MSDYRDVLALEEKGSFMSQPLYSLYLTEEDAVDKPVSCLASFCMQVEAS
jgi:hypothetical protein